MNISINPDDTPLLQKMGQATKELWVDALRSENYAQGWGLLCDGTGRYCCLGVLIDAVKPSAWVMQGRGHPQGLHRDYMDGDGPLVNDGMLPKKLLKELGMTLNEAEFFVDLNDSHRLTFKEIAAVIMGGVARDQREGEYTDGTEAEAP